MAQTLKNSTAKWKFVFVHHILGTNRGGMETVPYYEFGGENGNGTPGFPANRQPCTVCDAPESTSSIWPETIEQLLEENNVTIFFQAHDHLYVHQTYNNVTFQSVPNPADNTYYAFNADAYVQPSQTLYPNAGFLKVTVQPTGVNVQYIREWLPPDATRLGVTSGTVQDSYTIGTLAPNSTLAHDFPSGVVPIYSTTPTIQPGSWVTIYGTNLATSTATWTGNFPTSLGGTTVTINGKPAYLSYVSPTQIDLQAPLRCGDRPRSGGCEHSQWNCDFHGNAGAARLLLSLWLTVSTSRGSFCVRTAPDVWGRNVRHPWGPREVLSDTQP